jgi:hypothetical protein
VESRRPEERIDSFDDEDKGEPRLAIVEWPAGQDPLAEFAAEADERRPVSPLESLEPIDFQEPRELQEPLELQAPLELSRTYPTARGYKNPNAYRTDPGYRPQRSHRRSRTVLALCGLAAVAVISVLTLNSLSDLVAVGTPRGDVVVVNQPAPRSPSRAIEPAPPDPQ